MRFPKSDFVIVFSNSFLTFLSPLEHLFEKVNRYFDSAWNSLSPCLIHFLFCVCYLRKIRRQWTQSVLTITRIGYFSRFFLLLPPKNCIFENMIIDSDSASNSLPSCLFTNFLAFISYTKNRVLYECSTLRTTLFEKNEIFSRFSPFIIN